ncbi:MAG TPA: urate oxidase [Actinomycetes bacterium]|jgi:urate oxidase|nr:urate oxidase [Actinomycetes bacterium]
MRATLGGSRYGKSGIRLLRVDRAADRHELIDLTIDVALEGDFGASYLAGDNAAVLPTDTMRATVYAFAGERPIGEPEAFGLRLAGHFVATVPAATTARVHLAAAPWERIEAGGPPHQHAFVGTGGGTRTATVTRSGTAVWVVAGVAGLPLLKTAGSAFEGFLTDRYTTLEPTRERVLATMMSARWRYGGPEVDWAKSFELAWQVLVRTFADHDSRSLQHTLYAMGSSVLAHLPEIAEIRLTMPNRHHLLADLTPYGPAGRDEVFVATDRPFGLIEASVLREGAPPAGRAWE